MGSSTMGAGWGGPGGSFGRSWLTSARVVLRPPCRRIYPERKMRKRFRLPEVWAAHPQGIPSSVRGQQRREADGAAAEPRTYEHRFGSSPPLSIGVEEELLLVDERRQLA